MIKREWKKIALIILLIILASLIILTIFNFDQEQKEYNLDNDITETNNEIKFNNVSDMEEKEIRELVESKREELKEFLKNLKYSNISEVSSDHTKEDDDKYMALTESTLNELKSLLTNNFYSEYWNEVKEINQKPNIDLTERIYEAPITLFDDIYINSALAMEEVTEEILILKSATNEKIESIFNIKKCSENNPNICERDEKYNFVLELEENHWKIAKIV